MKEKILAELKTKFVGINEALLGRVADKLAKTTTTDEQVKPAVEGVTFQSLLEQYGDSRATEATQTAIRNYEQRHGLKDGKREKDDEPDKSGGGQGKSEQRDTTPAWAQALIDNNKALTERLNALDKTKTAKDRKAVIDSLTKELPQNLKKAYERISVADMAQEDFDKLTEEVKAEVGDIAKEMRAKSVVFNAPKGNRASDRGGGGNKEAATDEEAQAVVDKIAIV